jgi:hypothetical protein
VSADAFALCRPKERKNLRFFLKDMLAEPDMAFDVVMAIDVFEHVEDYCGFLRQLRGKGNYKVFHVPLNLSVQTVLRGSPILEGRTRYGHIHYFTKETALATLSDVGYSVISWRYTSGSVELPTLGWKAALMTPARKLLFALSPDWAARLLGGYSLLVLAK